MVILVFQSMVWTTSPERSFGSNQVDFGGMTPSASAIASTVSTATGCMATARAYSPESTRRSSPESGFAPPM